MKNSIHEEHEVHGVNPPMVYVKEKVAWQYKYMAIDLRKDSVPDEKLLNELGIAGWELACMFTYEKTLHAYFKRLVNH